MYQPSPLRQKKKKSKCVSVRTVLYLYCTARHIFCPAARVMPGGHRRLSSSSTPHILGRGRGRPVKTRGPPHGPGRSVHVEPIYHRPRSGPAHQICILWATARPGPSFFQRIGHGPARPINFSEDGPRPSPTHHVFKIFGPARLGTSRFKILGPARPGPARPEPSAHGKRWSFPQVMGRVGLDRREPDPTREKRLMKSTGYFCLLFFPGEVIAAALKSEVAVGGSRKEATGRVARFPVRRSSRVSGTYVRSWFPHEVRILFLFALYLGHCFFLLCLLSLSLSWTSTRDRV